MLLHTYATNDAEQKLQNIKQDNGLHWMFELDGSYRGSNRTNSSSVVYCSPFSSCLD